MIIYCLPFTFYSYVINHDNMKRSTSLIIASALSSIPLLMQAQESSQVMWGLRAALDINLPGKWKTNHESAKMFKPGAGVTVGGVCNIGLGNGFYLEPGVSLYYDAYSFDSIIIGSEDYSGQKTTSPRQDKAGFRIPVVLGYTIDVSERIGICFYTGPEFSYAFYGKQHFDNEILDEIFTGSPFEMLHRADCAWKIGVGFPFDSFMLAFDGAIGLTDLAKNSVKFHENRLSISLAYYF